MKYIICFVATLYIISLCPIVALAQKDPLPSWTDDSLKASIIQFVQSVTTRGTSTFVPQEDRIATFDNDGTLWAEQPLVELLFTFFRVHQMAEEHPAMKDQQPYKAILAGDQAYLKKLTMSDFLKLLGETHGHLTAEQFRKDAELFYQTAKTPQGKSIAEVVYQPQLELLKYLRANGFKTYICSGGDVDFMRVISWDYYGIPPEQVIGSSFKYLYKDTLGVNDLMRTTTLAVFNDKTVKPESIQTYIGKRPIFACGNEGGAGDVYMLRFSQGGNYPSFQMIVNHDDKDREFYYQEKDNKSLNWAAKYHWHVISMKHDWKTIFVTKD
jgi:hypothetical protein